MAHAWDSIVAVVGEIWQRAITRQPLPSLRTTLLLGLVALVLVSLRTTWRPVRMLSTMMHEAGHASAAVLGGRRLSGVRLHSDTSGLTLSRGRPRGPGMVATLAAGYPAPTVVAVAAAALLAAGYAVGLMWLLVFFCILLLVSIRNLYGLWVVVLVGGSLAVASWYLPALWLSWIAHLLVWLLLVSAPRPLAELARQRGGRAAHGSDVDQLARISRVPAVIWLALFWLVTVAGLAGGGYLLVRGSVLTA